jgi:membrane protease YdiL (CAAX protease family)
MSALPLVKLEVPIQLRIVALGRGVQELRVLTRFQSFVGLAQLGPTGVWRVLAGVVLTLATWCGLFLGALIAYVTAFGFWAASTGRPLDLNAVLASVTPPELAGVFLYLAGFLGMWLGLWASMRLLHKRRLTDIYGWARRVDLGEALRGGVAAAVAITLVGLIGSLFLDPPMRAQISVLNWLVLLVPMVVLICIQAGAEEAVFRGYMMQNLAAVSRSPIVWGLLPTLAFAALHILDHALGANPTGLPAWVTFTATMIAGGQLAILTWWTGGIGAAWAAHVVNNVVGLLIVTPSAQLGSAALYIDPFMMKAAWTNEQGALVIGAIVIQSVVTLALFWLLSGAKRAQPVEGEGRRLSRSD